MRYDPPSGNYTSRIPPGTQDFRRLVNERFSFTRSEVVRDRSRCNNKRSEHCDCRGIDFFTTDTAKGNKVFDWAVANAERYGIQSVIWQHRQWGFGKWYERFRKTKDHFDHVHIGLTIPGSQSQTEEEDLTPEEKKQLFKELKELKEALYTKAGRKKVDALDAQVKAIAKKVGA